MSALVFYYRRSEFTTDSQFTIRSVFSAGGSCRRAKPGRFGSFLFAMKNRHFGGECSWILAGKARKCGRFWVFPCVPNPGKQSTWRQCAPSARKQSTKKLPNRPSFTHIQEGPLGCLQGHRPNLQSFPRRLGCYEARRVLMLGVSQSDGEKDIWRGGRPNS